MSEESTIQNSDLAELAKLIREERAPKETPVTDAFTRQTPNIVLWIVGLSIGAMVWGWTVREESSVNDAVTQRDIQVINATLSEIKDGQVSLKMSMSAEIDKLAETIAEIGKVATSNSNEVDGLRSEVNRLWTRVNDVSNRIERVESSSYGAKDGDSLERDIQSLREDVIALRQKVGAN